VRGLVTLHTVECKKYVRKNHFEECEAKDIYCWINLGISADWSSMNCINQHTGVNIFEKFKIFTVFIMLFPSLGCISLHSYKIPSTSLYISTKERWVRNSVCVLCILFLSLVQMLKHKRKVAGRAYTVLNLDKQLFVI
jgi:hypothetical protein